MSKLNTQLSELQKTNKHQGEMFNAQLKTMQESNGKLQESINSLNAKNSSYSEMLSDSRKRCTQLEAELTQAKNQKGTHSPLIIAAMIIVALLIALIIK